MRWIIALLLLVSSTGLGELPKKEVKSLKKLFSIDHISFDTEKKHDTKFEIVTIEYSTDVAEERSNSYYSPKVSMKVVVELTDENKNTYLVKKTQEHYSIPSGPMTDAPSSPTTQEPEPPSADDSTTPAEPSAL